MGMKQLIAATPVLNVPARWIYRRVKARRGRRRLKRLKNVSPLRLVIGAGGISDPGWIETDIEYLDLLNPRDWEACFRRASIDAILAEHVWEHLTIEDGLAAGRRCFEYLRPGGYLRVAVPDGLHPDPSYIAYVRPGGTGPGAADHKVLYDHGMFADLFQRAGFRVELLEYFDTSGTFRGRDWNPEDGKIVRSSRFDDRNRDGRLNYTSIILDAWKDV